MNYDIPLCYSSILTDNRYSYLPAKKIFDYDSIAPHILGPNTGKLNSFPKSNQFILLMNL